MILRPPATYPSILNTRSPNWQATAPNQVWSWDITKLLGPQKWTYYYLYLLLDIFSRYVVGWMVADRENSALAGRLIEETWSHRGSEKLDFRVSVSPRGTGRNIIFRC